MSRELESRLRHAAPTVDLGDYDSHVSELVEAITATSRNRLTRNKRRLVAISAAAVVLAPTAAAAAIHFGAETGQFGKPGFTENDTSQYINMCAPDIAQYVATLEPRDRPLPAGTTWDGIRRTLLPRWQDTCPPRDSGAIMQVTGIKVGFLAFSECPWERDFLNASGPEAAAERQRAGDAIASAEDTINALGAQGDDGWKVRRNHAAAGDANWIAYDYKVNCS